MRTTSPASDGTVTRQDHAVGGAAGTGRLLTRREACDFFGIKLRTWVEWERIGKVPAGDLGTSANGRRCRVYPIAALQRLRDERDRRWEPYADPEQPGVVRVPIVTDKNTRMEALVDAADLPLVQGKRWYWSSGKPSHPRCGTVVLRPTRCGPRPSLGRVLLGISDPDQFACHRNGDRLDCRRENLVVRTRSQARRAMPKLAVRKGRAPTSRFKGVNRTENGRKWNASINVNGKLRQLGRFVSEVDAALAYDAALRELIGPDAPVNFTDPGEVERLRALEPVVEEGPFPPAGMVDRNGACRMFGVSLTTWTIWERNGRITCGQFHRRPADMKRCKLYQRDELERLRAEIEKLGKPYADPDRPGVWRVPLNSYVSHREALIDAADLPIVEGKTWNWSPRSDDGRTDGVVVLATGSRATPLHRLIAGVTDPKWRVSFANGDALDCRRANLLVRTQAEVSHATRPPATRGGRQCASKFKGVVFDASRGKWSARITKGGVNSPLGRFDSEREAALAYDAAARALFGNNAHLNFPEEPSTGPAMAEALRAMGSASNRTRAARRRQRDLERELRRAASGATPPEPDAASDGGATISRWEARHLFDVSRPVWNRWRRFGWLPRATSVDGHWVYPFGEIKRLLLQCGLAVLPYPDPQRPGVFRVPLDGKAANGREALVDADAVPLVQTRGWRFCTSGSLRGGEVVSINQREDLRLHYVVMGLTPTDDLHLGHRNDDPLDCRRANLVVRTRSDSHGNYRKQATFYGRPCTSRFKGVCWLRRSERWCAYITKGRVQRRLGTFRDEIAAAQAYDEAARELFGEHARLNFPDGVDARLEREAA